MVQKIINDLDVRYVAKAEHQAVPYKDATTEHIELVGTNEQHIFEADKEGAIAVYSFCGLTVHEIGDVTTTPQKIRDSKLPVCKECSDRWKADPRSHGVAIR